MLCLVCLLCLINVQNHVPGLPIGSHSSTFYCSKSLFMKTKNINPDLFEKSLNLLHVSASVKNAQERFSWLCDILTRTENIETLKEVATSFELFVNTTFNRIKEDLPYEPKE